MPHVYLVQPAELVGTNRYKLGMSSLSNLSRVKSYKVGTRYLCIFEQVDALATERKLKQAFGQRYKLIAGLEYFEVENEPEMIRLFMDIATGVTPTTESVAKKKREESIDIDELALDMDCLSMSPSNCASVSPSDNLIELDLGKGYTSLGNATTGWLKKYTYEATKSR